MDYQYIEQLIERYFAAETNLEEERILRQFFLQTDVPAHLQQWKALFAAESAWAEARLDDKFDQRILQLTGEVHVQARRITMAQRLRPLLRLAAMLIFAAGVGIAVQKGADNLPGQSASKTELQEARTQDELDMSTTTPLDLQADASTGKADSLATVNAQKY